MSVLPPGGAAGATGSREYNFFKAAIKYLEDQGIVIDIVSICHCHS